LFEFVVAQPNAILATDPSPWQQQATKVELVINLKTCVYRKLDSAILVVKATENWL
jgi:hypothetical protein